MSRPSFQAGVDLLTRELLGVPFGKLDPHLTTSVDFRNRGWVGQWLERRLGLENGSDELDFGDGELKSFELGRAWRPEHGQVAVATIDDPDTLIAHPPFADSVIARKLEAVVFAGYQRPSADPRDWRLSLVLVFRMPAAPVASARLEATYDHLLRQFSADARHLDDEVQTRDVTYRDDFLILKNKDSRQDGRYASSWSTELDRPISARRLGFYLAPGFFDFLAETPDEREAFESR